PFAGVTRCGGHPFHPHSIGAALASGESSSSDPVAGARATQQRFYPLRRLRRCGLKRPEAATVEAVTARWLQLALMVVTAASAAFLATWHGSWLRTRVVTVMICWSVTPTPRVQAPFGRAS